jgi:hypothetical protein
VVPRYYFLPRSRDRVLDRGGCWLEVELELFFNRSISASGHSFAVENFAVHFLRESGFGFCRVVVGDVCALWVIDYARPDA